MVVKLRVQLNHCSLKFLRCEPVWPSGKGVRLVSRRASARFRFVSPLSSKRLWFVDTVLWLCPSLPTETLKWLSLLPILMQESFWWWQCSDRYIISLFPPPPYSPSPPSLISLMVSVDVKHHVYLLAPVVVKLRNQLNRYFLKFMWWSNFVSSWITAFSSSCDGQTSCPVESLLFQVPVMVWLRVQLIVKLRVQLKHCFLKCLW